MIFLVLKKNLERQLRIAPLPNAGLPATVNKYGLPNMAVTGAEPIWAAALKSGGGAIAPPLPHAGYGPGGLITEQNKCLNRNLHCNDQNDQIIKV